MTWNYTGKMRKYMNDELLEYIGEINPDAMVIDGYDDCIIGIGSRCTMPPVLVYSRAKMMNQLIEEGLTEEEACEHISFNIEGAWVGEGTPIIMEPIEFVGELH